MIILESLAYILGAFVFSAALTFFLCAYWYYRS